MNQRTYLLKLMTNDSLSKNKNAINITDINNNRVLRDIKKQNKGSVCRFNFEFLQTNYS